MLASIKRLTSGKAPGADGIPPDISKHGCKAIAVELHKLFVQICQDGEVPQAFKDADMVHLYENKGDIKCFNNHRGVSLICIAGKILAGLLLNKLNTHTSIIRYIYLPCGVMCWFKLWTGLTSLL